YGPNPLAILLPHAQNIRNAAALLGYDSDRLAARGDIDAALRSARGSVNAGRSLGDEPFIISHLVRNACIALGLRAAEVALGQGQASDAELAALQEVLALEEKHPTYLVAVRGERAVMDQLLTSLMSGKVPMDDLFAMLSGGQRRDNPAYWYWRFLGTSKAD